MSFTGQLIQGRILKRYKRFLSDVELPSGEVIVAHTPNTGSMETCWESGWPACVSRSTNAKRKLAYTLELTHNGDTWINVNTFRTNDLAVQAIDQGTITELQGYPELKREAKFGHSRLDILLQNSNEDECCYVEVKMSPFWGRITRPFFPMQFLLGDLNT